MRGTLALIIFITFVGIALPLTLSIPSPLAVNTAPEADKAIRDANENLIDAYTAVVTAEKSGADVAVLTTNLNKALSLLNESRALYNTGNYPLAITRADDSAKISKSIVLSANELRGRAFQEKTFRNILTIAGVILVLIVLYFLGRLGWRWWNQRSYKKLMELRVKEVGVKKNV